MLYRIAKNISRRPVNSAIRNFCLNLPESCRVLCVGSGGPIEEIVRSSTADRNIEVVTSDVDGTRSPMIIDDICASCLPDGSFQAIIVAEVFEHLKDPQAASSEILRLLSHDGVAIVTTPFIFMIHDSPHDYFRYTRYSLLNLFSNFSNVEVVERGHWLDAIALLVLRMPMIGGKFSRIAAWTLAPPVLLLRALFRKAKPVKAWLMPVGYIVTVECARPRI
ncbi:MAG: methyltransferase domain-containing protein [Gallionella sp.]|nr:methyltransferase domain-containing protein [Gallionella sp.]